MDAQFETGVDEMVWDTTVSRYCCAKTRSGTSGFQLVYLYDYEVEPYDSKYILVTPTVSDHLMFSQNTAVIIILIGLQKASYQTGLLYNLIIFQTWQLPNRQHSNLWCLSRACVTSMDTCGCTTVQFDSVENY